MIPAEFTSHLMSVMAHEVKNQLQAIQAHVDILKLKVPGPGDTWKKVNELAMHVERLSDFVRGVGRLQCPVNFPPAPMDLAASLRDIVRLMQPLYQRYHVEIRADIPAHRCMVAGVNSCLQRCWINFLLNALNAVHARTKRGGWVRIALQARGGGYHVVIEDNGGGLPQTQLRRLNALVLPPRIEHDAHGLGVPEARRVVAQHSGVVEYANNDCGGCTVSVFLPLPVSASHPAPSAA